MCLLYFTMNNIKNPGFYGVGMLIQFQDGEGKQNKIRSSCSKSRGWDKLIFSFNYLAKSGN